MNVKERQEKGIPHHPKSIALYKKLAQIDFEQGGDYFDWNSGGDGDNGEHMMYEMDIMFEEDTSSPRLS
jgi:hypothetical protein